MSVDAATVRRVVRGNAAVDNAEQTTLLGINTAAALGGLIPADRASAYQHNSNIIVYAAADARAIACERAVSNA